MEVSRETLSVFFALTRRNIAKISARGVKQKVRFLKIKFAANSLLHINEYVSLVDGQFIIVTRVGFFNI